ncbi:MAG: EamA family transporter [Bauldia sp.]|nr:EamA family transporter [Bauldia sp.]
MSATAVTIPSIAIPSAGAPAVGGPARRADSETAVWLGAMVLLWGLSWPAMKLALGAVPPLWLGAIRFGSAAICLFVFLGIRGQLSLPPRKDWPILLSVGGLQMMAFTALGLIAMQHTDAGRAALLAYTTPLWGVIVAWLLVRQVPTGWQILALVIGMAGIAVIVSPLEMDWSQPGVLMGCVFLLLAAIAWSIVIVHVRRHSWTARPIRLAPWQMLLATIPLTIAAIVYEGSPAAIEWSPNLVALLAYIGPVATSACFVISAEYGRRVSTFAMSNITLGVPVVGVIASAILLGETVTVPLVIGLALIVAGVIVAGFAIRAKAAVNPATAERAARLGKTPQYI